VDAVKHSNYVALEGLGIAPVDGTQLRLGPLTVSHWYVDAVKHSNSVALEGLGIAPVDGSQLRLGPLTVL
jgi:hypothetical protein